MPTLPLPPLAPGKIRDRYRIPGYPGLLLVDASERMSTFDMVHLSLIPGKGALLTAQSVFWEGILASKIRGFQSDLVASGEAIWEFVPGLRESHPNLWKHATVVREYVPHPIEFIYRNYLTGSLARELAVGEDNYGLDLPFDLPRMSRFDPCIFTPTQKGKPGEKDEPLRSATVAAEYPLATGLTAQVFAVMTDFLELRGIAFIDSKFEAWASVLLDERGTGDSSRMSLKSDIVEGEDPPFLDKEPVRQETLLLWKGKKSGPPLQFSEEAVRSCVDRYHTAFELIAGMPLSEFQKHRLWYRAM